MNIINEKKKEIMCRASLEKKVENEQSLKTVHKKKNLPLLIKRKD